MSTSGRGRGLLKWGAPIAAMAATVALTGSTFAAGAPSVRSISVGNNAALTLSVTRTANRTDFYLVGGIAGRNTVYVYRLITQNKKLLGHTVMVAVRQNVLQLNGNGRVNVWVNRRVGTGIYEALEINGARQFVVSEPYAVQERNPFKAFWNVGGSVPSSPSETITRGTLQNRVIHPYGTLNGPTCGVLTWSWNASQGWTFTWDETASTATSQACSPVPSGGLLVTLVGAAPGPGNTNPFDNPPIVEGIWYGYTGTNGQTSITAGFYNNQSGFTTLPVGDYLSNGTSGQAEPGEWFAMSIFSSDVESPAGSLPEAPFAIALPAVLLGGVAFMVRRRRSAAV